MTRTRGPWIALAAVAALAACSSAAPGDSPTSAPPGTSGALSAAPTAGPASTPARAIGARPTSPPAPDRAISGRVADASGNPAQGVTVVACPADEPPGSDGCRSSTSGPDGGYVIAALEGDWYRLACSDPSGRPGGGYLDEDGGYAGAWEDAARVPAGSVLDLRLAPAYRIAGSVTNDGAPVPDAEVRVRADLPGSPGSGRTDAAGRYEVRGLAPGSYDLAVWCPAGVLPGPAGPERTVRVDDRDVLDVDLDLNLSPPASSVSSSHLPAVPASLRLDRFARVLADDLVVRSMPYVGAGSRILAEHVYAGGRLFIVAGPVRASGYDWYQVAGSFGWVAAGGRDGASWLEGLQLACPRPPVTIAQVLALTDLERLVCFGHATLSFDAYWHFMPAGAPAPLGTGIYCESGWASPEDWAPRSIGTQAGSAMLGYRLAPGVSGPRESADDGRGFRFTGHFGDLAPMGETSCTDICTGQRIDRPTVATQLEARVTFMVTALEPLSSAG